MDFQLLRLILIDSYSAGRVVEFPLDGGAVLTGRNGRGKTTLLQLIPIFYGENPTRIVGTETNRLDFNGFYLPRLTSYICYEYRRRDQVSLVVLHQSQQGADRRYRFVRTAYRPDLFLLDERNILQAPDLRRHFKLKGVLHSESIAGVREYRSIIQGKSGSGKGWQRQRQLVADYAFVGSGHHLTHIEKIVSGMFLRRTDFQDLQRMVVSCISDGDEEIALKTERRKIAAWPDHYRAYMRAMGEQQRMAEALELEARLAAVETELGRIHARILRLLGQLDAASNDNRRQKAAQAAQAGQEEQAHRQGADGIRIRIEVAGREAKAQEARVAALEEQNRDWLERDLPKKAEVLEREPQIRQQREHLDKRREALLGEQEKISLKYERLINDLDRRHNQSETAASAARTRLFASFEPRLRDLAEQALQEMDALRETQRLAHEAVEIRLREALEQKGEWGQRARDPQPDPALLEIRDAKRTSLDDLKAEQQAAAEQTRARRNALEQTKAAYQAQEGRVQRLGRQREDLRQQRRLRVLQQSPGEGSLLHFLRTDRPDWAFDIAKVVREDLLVRTDLEPELLDTLPALYGVGLELGHVEALLAADESALQQETAEIEAQIARVEADRSASEAALEEADRARRAADEALTLANHALKKVEASLGSAEEELRSAQRQVDRSRRQSTAEAATRLDELAQIELGLKAELKELDRGHRQTIEERQRRLTDARAALEHERGSAIDAHDAEQARQRRRHARERGSIEAERDQALGAAGVDTETLKRIEEEIAKADGQLDGIRRSRNEVGQWRIWLDTQWRAKDEHVGAAQEARAQEAAARRELEGEERRWKARSGELQSALSRLEREHARLEQELAAVRGRLDAFRAFPPDEEVLGRPFDPGWTLEGLSEQANTNQSQAAELGKAIGRIIEQIKRAFSQARDTPPDQFFESHRARLGPDA